MKLLHLHSLNGPNYWSVYRKKLIVLKLDLEKFEYLPTNKIPGFAEALKSLIPSLYTHRCSPGIEGGFCLRMEDGTWLGHVIEHVALELQCLAGMDCGFGRTFGSGEEGIYYVLFAYHFEEVGIYAAHAAIRIVSALANKESYHGLQDDINHLKALHAHLKLGPSTQALVDEAAVRKIPVSFTDSSSLMTFGYGIRQKKMWATISSFTNTIGVDIAANKELTKHILSAHFIPVPKGHVVSSLAELEKVATELGFPLVIKPKMGNHGQGVTTNITNQEKLVFGFAVAQKISSEVIVERFIEGDDYRILVVNYKVVAVARRTAAHIIGTGTHTIRELIALTNQDPRRGKAHGNLLTEIEIDDNTQEILQANKVTLETVLPKNQILILKDTANLSSGGTATDVTDEIHSENKELAERIARLVGLDICGIDLVAKNISLPIHEKSGAILEVNASPGLRMHLSPCQGTPRNVAVPILEHLFPKNMPATIPLVAVTGTNGKTTVVRLIANMAKKAHHCVGYTTTEGIYVDGKLLFAGDCSGPASAKAVLLEPTVDFAVLECARGGLLRSGLGFEECDISIITNVSSDHLGLNDINTLDELATLKGVLARSTKKEGYAILNAEDDLVYALKDKLACQVALFSKEKSPRIHAHCAQGGLAAYIEQGTIIIHNGCFEHKLMAVTEIPLTYHGTATCMTQNILPAILAGFLSNFSYDLIKGFLQTFLPTADNLPGRMNLFRFPKSQVMVDYAHNEGAFVELGKFLQNMHCERKIGIIGAPGDRRDEDIETIGYLAAQSFDEIIIRYDKDGRGRSHKEMSDLLIAGIQRFSPQVPIRIINDEIEAIEHAMQHSYQDAFIFCAVEKVFEVVEHLKNAQRLAKVTSKASVL